ncbi:hypothetical protein CKN82_07475 [Carnobacterium divergens]|uniref:ABC transporter permease n=1 Tax=Carnobacterium divergens TaxID=2748 RepID=UPI001072333E|nr:ABC transporter permease [Carnobacterium divergens]TFI68875.1 hypothetical protein CKN70_07525 [Carnobacterium divergens]TFI81347.1 hypothetical protein CKN68_07485 [Carnobacterium divergens]TFI88839.1 hypothetical protein CKN72_07355 [Carnobacterium divergens]TFI97908.1 hypothetical protein CKN67_07490 [Carnobacterium divergens]TFI98769.1 hypothetical protein CKN82_07475 [Carnobacterium divergens]
MNYYNAFIRKEFLKLLRTKKWLIIFIVFLFIGCLSPLMAKMTPQLLESFYPNNLSLRLPVSKAIDSWREFFKNVPQLGLSVMVIIFCGTVSNEVLKKTLVNFLTKGLPRQSVILAKMSMLILIWTLSLVGSFSVNYVYTISLWKGEAVLTVGAALFLLWLFGVVLLGVVILGSTIMSSAYWGLLFVGGFIGVCLIMNILPNQRYFNFLALISNSSALLEGTQVVSDYAFLIGLSLAHSVCSIVFSIIFFNKKSI